MSEAEPKDLYEEERAAILKAALHEADFEGFSVQSLRAAADAAGVSREVQRLAFPRGVMDLVAYYSETADKAMLARLASEDLAKMKIRERIAFAVRTRIEALAEHKPAARRAMQLLALPQFAPEGLKLLYRTVDAIWRGVGDTSTDFNFYSKRALLAGVYSATLLRWFEDDSDDGAPTWAFLARRIEDVMKIEKAKGAFAQRFGALPDPLNVLSRLRYPDRTRPR
jgi:ubiquinone biosynthesis protein COQ9